jgi:hypothetical protein
MKTIKRITLGIIPVFLFFGAMAQQEGQEQGQFQHQEQTEQDQMQQDQVQQDLDQQDERRMQAQFQEFHDPQPFGGEDLEEALLTLGNIREWDNTGDGRFDAAEFYVVLFHIWDRNHDGTINQDEWEYGTTNFLSDYNREELGDFGDWDEDGNNELDINEFARGIESAELYNASPRLEPDEQDQRLDQEREMEPMEQDAEQDMAPGQEDTDMEQDLNLGQQDTREQERTDRQVRAPQREGEYVEPAQAIVIWERRGVVEKIEVGDRTISLGSDVGRQQQNNNDSNDF